MAVAHALRLLLAAVALSVMGASGGIQTTELWVTPNGADGAAGTQSAPLRSIQEAADRAGPGTVIYVQGRFEGAGSSGNGYVTLRNSGFSGAPIKLTAPPGGSAELVVRQGEAVRIEGSYIEVSGLTITGVGGSSSADYGYGILIYGRAANNHHVTINGNVVSGFSVGGIAANWSNHITINGNRVHGNSNWGTEGGSGISLLEPSNAGGQATNRITNNVSFDNRQLVNSTGIGFNSITDGNCIQLDRLDMGSGAGQRAEVTGNVAHSCGGRGINVFDSSNVSVEHNVTRHNGDTASLAAEVYVQGGGVELRGNVLVPAEGRDAVVGSPTFDDSLILKPQATLEEALSCIVPGQPASLPESTAAVEEPSSTAAEPSSTAAEPSSTTVTAFDMDNVPIIPSGATCDVEFLAVPESAEDVPDDPGGWSMFDMFVVLLTLFLFSTLLIYSVQAAYLREREW